jgi:hypothetical protein
VIARPAQDRALDSALTHDPGNAYFDTFAARGGSHLRRGLAAPRAARRARAGTLDVVDVAAPARGHERGRRDHRWHRRRVRARDAPRP